MKKYPLLIVLLISSAIVKAQLLINYGNNTVSKSEFLRAYNKNKTPTDDKEKAIRDYVTLYTNFKLKVKAAKELKLDTSEQIKVDIENFSKQIQENYLNDEKTFKAMMKEAFERSQYDLHLIRYTISMDENVDPSDTSRRTSEINELYQQLKSGKENTEPVSSLDVKEVDMGYVTVFSLPYQYENFVYNLPVDGISTPYRSKKAWHIFKLIDKRKSAGRWRVAQILFTSPINADENTKSNAKALSDSVYKLLKGGADFASLARVYSDDKLTYMGGGEMPEFGAGNYDNSFESEVLKLKNDGDISMPFTTSFGIHIVKRISLTPTPASIDDEGLQFDLKQKLLKDDRIKIAKDKFARDILTKIGFKIASTVNKADLFKYADEVMKSFIEKASEETPISKKTIISFLKGNIKGEDWLKFVIEYKSNPELYAQETNEVLWEKYKNIVSVDYYSKHLAEYNTEYANQIEEFKEGNMLFEVMEKQVWSKASSDTVGLKNYYNENRKHYIWSKSADAIVMNCVSEPVAIEALASMQSGLSWHNLLAVKQGEIQGDSGRFEIAQIGGDENALPGTFSAITKNPDGTASFIKYIKHYPNGDQRSFADAKGMAINDYQLIVEKNWLEELKKKSPVKVNEALLKEIIKTTQ